MTFGGEWFKPGGKREGTGRAILAHPLGTCRPEELNKVGGGAFVKRAVLVIALILLVIQGVCVHAEGESDQRVEALLGELELKYQIDSDGDFRLILKLDSGRTQLVFVNSRTETLDEFEIREIWSVAYVASTSLSSFTANMLLLDSYKKKIGAWQTVKDDGKYIVMFAAKIPADCEASMLNSTLWGVAESADQMERDLTGKDNF